MKNAIIVILLIVSVALGGLLIHSNKKTAAVETELAKLQTESGNMEMSVSEKDEQIASLREKLDKSVAAAAVNAGEAAQLSQALTNHVQAEAQSETNSKSANPFSEMFKNPEMREMIKKQQKTVMGGMVDKNYADFIKTMQMTPEQATAFKDLVLKKMLGDADMGMEMMGGDLDAERRAELTKQMKANKDATDEEIKALLGSDNYSLYESYQKSIPDRMAINGFKDQLPENAPLHADQEQQLIQALGDERQGFKFTTDYSDQSKIPEDFTTYFSEDKMAVYFQEQDQLNQRYLARAKTILSAEQYSAYEKSLKTQQEMAKMGMKMAAQMFGKKK